MTPLEHVLERSVLIRATRATVFRFFTDSARFAEWWGPGSRIEGRAGGVIAIRYPNGVTASGTVIDLVDGERIVFSYGYEAPNHPIPPGGSRVTITLRDHPEGTLLELRHELADVATRDDHVAGWRYQLALFANVAARHQHGDIARLVDRYFSSWNETDGTRRLQELGSIASADVTFRDAFGCTIGLDDLSAHVGASQLHMPGTRLRREGDVRQCQGTALADWVAVGGDGSTRGRGTNVFEMAPDGRIAGVVGFLGELRRPDEGASR